MENSQKYTTNSYELGVKSCVITTIGIQSHVPRKMAANSFERLLDKMDDFAVDFNRKCNQISDMLTHIHNQSQICEETHFQPEIAVGVCVKRSLFSPSYNLRIQTLESPHLQSSSPFISVPSLPKVIANDTNDVEEAATGMTKYKVFDEMPNLEIEVVCEGDVTKTKEDIGVVENEDDWELIKSSSTQTLRNHAAVKSFSRNKVAIIGEWKVCDKMSMRKMETELKQEMSSFSDCEDSCRKEVDITARPVPDPPPPKLLPISRGLFVDEGHSTGESTTEMTKIDEVFYFNKENTNLIGTRLEVAVEENENDDVLVKFWSRKEVRNSAGLFENRVPIVDEWKLSDKMPLRKIEFAIDRGKKRCLDDEDSSKMDVIKSQQVSPWLIEKVVVHPFVLLSIADHYNQVACDIRNVVLDEFGYPKVVNNGVTVACAIELPNVMRNASATWIREVANTINYSAGDGTTIAFVLAHEIIKLGLFSVIFGERRKSLLQDVAILTGAEYQATDLGLLVEDTGIYQLGIARKVAITKDSTTIIVDAATKGELQARIAPLKKELSETNFEKLADRIAKLSSGVVMIKVDVATETDTRFATVMVVVVGLIKDVQVKPDITHLRETIFSLNLSSLVRRVEKGPTRRETDHAEFLKYTQQTKQDERETKKLQDIVQALQFRLTTREYICINIQVRYCDLENQVAEGKKKTEIDPGGLDMNAMHLIVMANVGGCSIHSYNYQNTVNCYERWKMTNHGVEELDVRDDPGGTTMIKCFEKNNSDTIMICDLGGNSFYVLKFEVTRGQEDITNETRIKVQVLIESVCSVGCVEFVDKTFSRLFFMLLKQRKIVEAEVSIKRLFGKEKVAEVMGNLDSTSQSCSCYRNVVSVGAILFLFQQFFGLNAVVYYSTSVFPSEGITSDVATSVLVGAANVFGTSVSSSPMVKQGRKGLYLACFAGIAISMMFSLSISRTMLTLSDTLVVLETVLCVLSFSLGAGPVPTQPVPEIFASKIRAKAVVLFPSSKVDPWGQGSKIGGSNVMYTQMVNVGEEEDVVTRIQKREKMALLGLVYEIGNLFSG